MTLLGMMQLPKDTQTQLVKVSHECLRTLTYYDNILGIRQSLVLYTIIRNAIMGEHTNEIDIARELRLPLHQVRAILRSKRLTKYVIRDHGQWRLRSVKQNVLEQSNNVDSLTKLIRTV